MALKISLAKWAVQQFDPPPADRTLRLWVKAGRIIPAPIKIGKTWYVEPGARHIAEVMAGDRLVNRLRRG
ncbi:excisionase [Variovorax sp. YR752]|uniref:excisionase n=1 Tax=Variovorax sp. YR752 TaxID=1884383 RepID=UPI003137B7C3